MLILAHFIVILYIKSMWKLYLIYRENKNLPYIKHLSPPLLCKIWK